MHNSSSGVQSTRVRDDNTTIAWTQPKNPRAQKARRVKVWLKHSMHNLASPSAVDFENDESTTASSSFRRRDAANRPLHRSSSSNISTTTSRENTTTIDQAMFSLYTYVGSKKKVSSVIQVEPETPSSYLPEQDYDWLLDGRREWRTEDATSQEYIQYLEQPWDMEGYLEKYLQEREEKFQKELEEDEQKFQFEANFDQSAFVNNEEEEDFGDFQEASENCAAEATTESSEAELDDHTESNNPSATECKEEIVAGKSNDADDPPTSKEFSAAEEEEEKSQEEVIVEEAVEILKSMPTKDFNDNFAPGSSPEKIQVLVDTCNLATELERIDAEQHQNSAASETAQKPSNLNTAAGTNDGVADDSDDQPHLDQTATDEASAPGGNDADKCSKEEDERIGEGSHGNQHVDCSSHSKEEQLDSSNEERASDGELSAAEKIGTEVEQELPRDEVCADSSDDDSFGDFQNATNGDDPQPSSTVHTTTAEADTSTDNKVGHESTASALSESVRPTLAVLPPLRVEVDAKSPSPLPRNNMNDAEEIFSTSSLGQDPSEESLSDHSKDEEEDIRISLRLPITDLSTPVARFARRQKQKYRESIRMKEDPNNSYPASTSSLFSAIDDANADCDDDSDGEQHMSLADLDLPHSYFTQDYDDTTRVLQNAPWHHITHMWDLPKDESMGLRVTSSYSNEDLQDSQALWDEYITQELCHLDSAQNQVAKHLLRRLRPHEGILQKANQAIHEFATNLQLAQMYLARSQGSVRQAARGNYDHSRKTFDEGSGWFGAHDLLSCWSKKEMYSNLDDILRHVQEIFEAEKSLNTSISCYTFQPNKPREYFALLQRFNKLKSEVNENTTLSRVMALNDLRARLAQNDVLKTFYNRLHQLAESVAVRCCRIRPKGLLGEYQSLLEAVVTVHELNEDSCNPKETNEADDKNKPSLQPALTDSWTNAIIEALRYEADHAFATALLDPLDDPNMSADSQYERELTQLAYDVQQDWGDTARLRTLTHNLVIIRFDWESSSRHFVSVYHRLCLQLADVLYAHHLLSQWHEKFLRNVGCSGDPSLEDSKEEKIDEAAEVQTLSTGHAERLCGTSNSVWRRKIAENIHDQWNQTRSALWQRCQDVLILCLDEYLNFASIENFFKEPQKKEEVSKSSSASNSVPGASSSGDGRWYKDLEELHDVLTLTEQFCSLKSKFLGDAESGVDVSKDPAASLETDIRDKLCDVFRKHLRFVHVEAMKGLGSSLSREDWEIVPLKQLCDFEKRTATEESDRKVSIDELLVGALQDATLSFYNQCHTDSRSNAPRRSLFGCQIATTFSTSNGFIIADAGNSDTSETVQDALVESPDSEFKRQVLDLVRDILAGGDQPSSFTRLVSKSAVDVFFSWIARLLLVVEKLPIIVEDVSVVFANLFDLYLTTVFRICSGSAQAERILFGIEPPSAPKEETVMQVPPSTVEKSSVAPGLFAFGRRSSSSLGSKRKPLKVELPATLEADLCAPLLSETSNVSVARKFIERAQKTLSSIVLLDKVDQWIEDPVVVKGAESDDKLLVKTIKNFEQRLGATFGCLGVVLLLNATCSVARNKLSHSPRALDDLSTLEYYSNAALNMVPQLIRLLTRISAVRAIMARRVVTEIVQVGAGWNTDKMNEHANDYVDALCGRCSCIWAALSTSRQRLPSSLLKVAWEGLVEGSYASMLEGFSRVSHCSTEGRALMSMDLASFAAGIQPSAVMERLDYQIEYEAPPRTDQADNGMRYVDTYVKAFYFPPKDVMSWIVENHEHYQLNHFIKLASHAYRNEDNAEGSVEEALDVVKRIFLHHDEGQDR